MRRAGIGALVLLGLLAGHDVARSQFGFGSGPNPFMNNRQYLFNLQLGRAALANSMLNASAAYALPYPTPAYNPYAAYGGNPYLPGELGVGSNVYSPGGSAYDPYSSNPYSAYSPYSNPYSNPAIGPGFTLMGGADVIRAYGTLITKQEEGRIMREQWRQAMLETEKKKFDLRMYIRNNTPTFTEEQAKVTRQTLKRIQSNSQPAEVVEGRSLNFLIDDVDRYRNKATIADIDLPADVLKHLNIKPAGVGSYSLGMLRDGGKLNWPSALVDMLPGEVRKEMDSRAAALAQAAAAGREPDRNALKDFRIQIEQAKAQLLKKANDFGTPEYMDAKRFLSDLDNARLAIDRPSDAAAQVQYQQMLAKGEIHNLNDLVKVMIERGWRFAPALASDEAAYRALHSALVAYDLALNQQVAQGEGQ
jgi:hypothetical protein